MLPGQTLDAHAVNLRIGEPHLDVDALYVLKDVDKSDVVQEYILVPPNGIIPFKSIKVPEYPGTFREPIYIKFSYRPEPEVLQEPSQAATSIRLPKITFLGAFLTLVLVIGFIAAATQVYSMFTYTLLRAQRAGSGGKVLRVELTVPGLKSETVDLGHNSAISATETLEPPVGTDEQHDRVAAGESGAPFMTNAPSLQLPSGAATHDIEGGMHSAAAAMETAVQIGKEVAGAVLPEEHAVGALAEFAEMTHHTPMPLSPHAAHKAGPSPVPAAKPAAKLGLKPK